MSSHGGKGQGHCLGPLIKASVPFRRASPSWPNHLPKAHLQIPSYEALGFNIWILGDTNIQSLAEGMLPGILWKEGAGVSVPCSPFLPHFSAPSSQERQVKAMTATESLSVNRNRTLSKLIVWNRWLALSYKCVGTIWKEENIHENQRNKFSSWPFHMTLLLEECSHIRRMDSLIPVFYLWPRPPPPLL